MPGYTTWVVPMLPGMCGAADCWLISCLVVSWLGKSYSSLTQGVGQMDSTVSDSACGASSWHLQADLMRVWVIAEPEGTCLLKHTNSDWG